MRPRRSDDGTCPVCHREYLFSIPTRLDTFAVEALYRHHLRGTVYFHEIE